jgi:hypothetical protein
MTECPSPFPSFEPKEVDATLFKSLTSEITGRQTQNVKVRRPGTDQHDITIL